MPLDRDSSGYSSNASKSACVARVDGLQNVLCDTPPYPFKPVSKVSQHILIRSRRVPKLRQQSLVHFEGWRHDSKWADLLATPRIFYCCALLLGEINQLPDVMVLAPQFIL
jgi:hypothetical protein